MTTGRINQGASCIVSSSRAHRPAFPRGDGHGPFNALREYETKRACARDVPISRRLCEPVGDTLSGILRKYISQISLAVLNSFYKIGFLMAQDGRDSVCSPQRTRPTGNVVSTCEIRRATALSWLSDRTRFPDFHLSYDFSLTVCLLFIP